MVQVEPAQWVPASRLGEAEASLRRSQVAGMTLESVIYHPLSLRMAFIRCWIRKVVQCLPLKERLNAFAIMERHMKSLALFGLIFAGMTFPAFAKTGFAPLDEITGMFDSVGNNSSWLLIAAIAFVIYIAGSAHRA
jgi:hypothetical protein